MIKKSHIVALAFTVVLTVGICIWPDAAGNNATSQAGNKAAMRAVSTGMNKPNEVLASDARLLAPPDVSQKEWDRVVASMKATNDMKDLQQVGNYLTFQHRAAKWRQMKAQGANPQQRAELDHYLLQSLPVHVSRGEMTGWEAQSMALALLQDSNSDPASLEQAVQSENEILKSAAPQPDVQQVAKEQSQMSAYRQKEAAIITAWQNMPVAQRNQAWLETQLDQARQTSMLPPQTTQ